MGPAEQLWRERDFLVVEVPGLRRRMLMLTAGLPPCAMLPAGVEGQARDDLFAGLLVEYAARRIGWAGLARRVASLGEGTAAALTLGLALVGQILAGDGGELACRLAGFLPV